MPVSVIIPAYNAASCLRNALDSVFSQTHPVDEVIVIDDGSTDSTCEVAKSYGPRLVLLTQRNQGPSVARNRGVETATSDFIAFLDADDQWFPEKIERQLQAFAAAPASTLCYTSMVILADEREIPAPACPLNEVRFRLRLGNPGITPSCVMLPRSRFLEAGGFNPEQIIGEDWDLWIRLLRGGDFCIVEQPMLYYRASKNSLSSDADKMYAEAQRMVDARLLDGLKGLTRRIWRRRILSYCAYGAALTARGCSQTEKEVAYLKQSLRLWPSPFWFPVRFKSAAMTARNSLKAMSRST